MSVISQPLRDIAIDAIRDIRREHSIRLRAAGLVLFFMTLAFIGVAWDVQWHVGVGRDSFWIPPHLFVYSGVFLSGVTCILTVLHDTWRYYRHAPGVTRSNTIGVFGIFRGPLGIVLSGLGLTLMLAAAPFDDWWHNRFGIDTTIWSPPHLLGIAGGTFAVASAALAFASEANRDPRSSHHRTEWRLLWRGMPPASWLTLAALAATFAAISIALLPALTPNPRATLGPVTVLSYPVLLALSAPLILVASVSGTYRIGAATLVGFIFLAIRTLINLLVPPAMLIVVPLVGEQLRSRSPQEVVLTLGYPALLPLAGLLIDLGVWLALRARVQVLPVLLILGSLSALLLAWLEQPWTRFFRSVTTPLLLETLVVVLLAGMFAGFCGYLYGRVLATITR